MQKLTSLPHVPGEILARFATPISTSQENEVLSRYGANIAESFEFGESPDTTILRLKLPPGQDLAKSLEEMNRDEHFEFAEPNYIIEFDAAESAELMTTETEPDLWGLENKGQFGGVPGADISIGEAWKLTTGSRQDTAPIIAIHDTGVDLNHPDIKANLWLNQGEIPNNGLDDDGNGVVDDVHGYNAVEDNGHPLDGNRHGTHVTGTIGAVGDDDFGITGVMKKARLMPVKIFADDGRTSSDIIVRALSYSAKMGAKLTNNSFGARPSEAIRTAFFLHPALHIMAAGNRNSDNDKNDVFPANYNLDNVLSVAATDRRDERAPFSNFGQRNVDITAPGKEIWSTFPGGGHTYMDGTSMAAPHVTGTAGLLLTAYPHLTTSQLKDRLVYGSDRLPHLQTVSWSGGRLNAASALEQDDQKPGKTRNLRFGDATPQGAKLQWSTPADDGTAGGPAAAVELRFSDQPITVDKFTEAALLANSPAGEVVGETAAYQLELLPDSKPRLIHLATQVIDNVGNRSEVSTVNGLIPAARSRFIEEFSTSKGGFETTGNFYHKSGHMVAHSIPGRERSPESTLTSPLVELPTDQVCFLKFNTKQDLYWENEAWVEIKGESQTWKRILRLDNTRDWMENGVDLTAYGGQQLKFRFRVSSRWGEPRQDLLVDTVELLTYPAERPQTGQDQAAE